MTKVVNAFFAFVLLSTLGCGGSSSVNQITVTAPASVSFGQVATGTSSPPLTVTIVNTGSAAFTLTSEPTIGGTNASDFAITSTTCTAGTPIAVSQSCVVTVTFTPSSAMSKSATLDYNFSGASNGISVALSGTGVVAVENVLPGQVTLSLSGNVNAFFVTLTLCVPGTSTCQTIPNVEIDTGSSGLRLIANSVTIPLLQALDGSGNDLGNCIQFADASYAWGPVKRADIRLSGEIALDVPIQLINDANFAPIPTGSNGCVVEGGSPILSTSTLGANGLLGIGLFRQDCGLACSLSPIPRGYYSCSGSSCSPTSASLSSQLQNPVWKFSQDNNGFIMSLPSISAAGAATVQGSIIFGINTKSNNTLGSTQVYTANSVGNISTTYNGQTYPSFIDSGSNGLFFLTAASASLQNCSSAQGFYCPSSTQSFTVTNQGQNGASGTVTFSIGNAESLFMANPSFSAFNNIGGSFANAFDFGMPFFYGKRIYFGIEGQTVGTDIGPLYAY